MQDYDPEKIFDLLLLGIYLPFAEITDLQLRKISFAKFSGADV